MTSSTFRHRAAAGAIALLCTGFGVAVAPAKPSGVPGNFRAAPSSPVQVSGSEFEAIVAAQLDAKPGVDLALVNSDNCCDPFSIAVLSGKRNGAFSQTGTETVAGIPFEITAADLDGENGTDLAVATVSGTTVLLNDGTGEFTEPATSPEMGSGGVTSADFDGDDKTDLVVGDNASDGSGTVLLNDGSGDFTAGDSFAAPGSDLIANADVDDDDDRDVIAVDGYADTPMISLNDGDGNFTDGLPLAGANGGDSGGIAIGRINPGPSADIAYSTTNGVDVFLGDGDGGFSLSPRSPLGEGRFFGGVRIADVDRDGRADVLAGEAPAKGRRTVAVFLGRKHGRFKEPDTSPERVVNGNNPPWLATGKFDRRKGLDVAAATGSGGALSILLNRSPLRR